jgi:AAHS family 4-hydroxybenzoate transporter-like MFS transporter
VDGPLTYDVSKIIDAQRMGPIHWLVVGLSFSLMLIDGYDLICIVFVAPILQKEWGFPRASFGLLFGAATLGTSVGPLIFGTLADKLGRKPVLLLGTAWFGVFTLAAVLATNLHQMLILRFVAGVGLGGVIATSIAFVAEFAPRRIRATMIVMGVVGVALGGGVGALIASHLLGLYTWRCIFWIGGLTPLAVALIGAFIVPESPKYLTLRPAKHAALIALLKRLDPTLELPPNTRFILSDEQNGARFSYAAAFSGRLAAIVPLLMLTTFLAQFALFFVNQWTTILLTSNGTTVQRAALSAAAFQIAGFIGALAVTRPVDRFGFLPVPILFAAAAVIIAAMGMPNLGENTIIVLAGAAGFCVIGLQFGNIATTGQVFPTYVRSGGVGLCYGIGRIGSVAGPVIAGVLVGFGFSINSLFYLAGTLMLTGVVAGALMVPLYKRQLAEMGAAAAIAQAGPS